MFEKLVKIAIKIPPLRKLLEKLVKWWDVEDEKNYVFGCSRGPLYEDEKNSTS